MPRNPRTNAGRTLLLAVLILSGCSKTPAPTTDAGASDAGADGGAASISTGAFCSDFLSAVCNLQIRCKLIDVAAADCLSVEAQVTPECSRGLLDAGELVPSSLGVNCLSALQAATCSGADLVRANEACNGSLFAPNVPLGGACEMTEACVPVDGGAVACVRPSSLACGGTCSAGQPLGAGCAPTEPGMWCADGWCDLSGGDGGTCTAFAAAGEPCSTASCAPSLYCDPTSQHCAARVGVGGSCAGDVCQAGLHCGDESCRATAPHGGACDPNDQQGCAFPDGCVSGTCQAIYAFVGQACGPGISCEDSDCVNGVCTAAPGLGESCGTACGFGYLCDAGTCIAAPGPGEPCPNGTCGGGLWCDQGQCAQVALTGETCGAQGPPCLWGYCDPATSRCRDYAAPLGPCTTDTDCQPVSDVHMCDLPADGGVGHCNVCDPIR